MDPLLQSLIGSEIEQVAPEMGGLVQSIFGGGGNVGSKIGAGTSAMGGDVQSMVRRMAQRRQGWGGQQWDALQQLVQNESSWNPLADNPESSAYGLFQFLDSTWDSGYGGITDPTSNPRKQARAGLDYIDARYGDPISALAFWNQNHWY